MPSDILYCSFQCHQSVYAHVFIHFFDSHHVSLFSYINQLISVVDSHIIQMLFKYLRIFGSLESSPIFNTSFNCLEK